MQSFLKPLDAKEEMNQINKMKDGDTKARELLIRHNLRLVAHIVKKYNIPERDLDDFISIGTIGLIKAIDSFDPDKNIRLATYASRCIDNELLMVFRSSKKQSREVSINEPIGSDREGNEISLIDILEYEDQMPEDKLAFEENKKRLNRYLFEALNEREREIIFYRYGLFGYPETTQKDLADRFHISRSYVSRLETKALSKLKACFPKE